VSPPSEHAVLPRAPWWQRYQTVSYALDASRSGTAAELASMVERCARAGVGIYVDAVINHMTGQSSGVGSHGTAFTKYEYPGLYAATDFHQPPCTINGADYANAPDRVRRCELVGLADLDTGAAAVRAKIVAYLNALVDLGVAGFRLDASKHMDPADLDAVIGAVNAHAGPGHAPFFFLEVIDGGAEAIHATDYSTVGASSGQAASVTDFQYRALFDEFGDAGGGSLAEVRTRATLPAALPSAQAVVFATNHDTERAGAIAYHDGAPYDLATVFLLANPYGYPSLMSSYAFDRATAAGRDAGPPSDAAGHTNAIYAEGSRTPSCAPDGAAPASGTWVCQHRRPFVARMLAFRKATLGADALTDVWSDGLGQLAFGRGAKGFVALNRGAAPATRTFATSLPAGAYCDVYGGALERGTCTGATITVDAAGAAAITVPSVGAVVIHVGAAKRLGS
jgi:alpha-amylase